MHQVIQSLMFYTFLCVMFLSLELVLDVIFIVIIICIIILKVMSEHRAYQASFLKAHALLIKGDGPLPPPVRLVSPPPACQISVPSLRLFDHCPLPPRVRSVSPPSALSGQCPFPPSARSVFPPPACQVSVPLPLVSVPTVL